MDEPVVTQKDIEDVALFAAQRGLTVLQLGMSREQMAAYNRVAFAKARIVLSKDGIELRSDQYGAPVLVDPTESLPSLPVQKYSGAIQLVCIE